MTCPGLTASQVAPSSLTCLNTGWRGLLPPRGRGEPPQGVGGKGQVTLSHSISSGLRGPGSRVPTTCSVPVCPDSMDSTALAMEETRGPRPHFSNYRHQQTSPHRPVPGLACVLAARQTHGEPPVRSVPSGLCLGLGPRGEGWKAGPSGSPGVLELSPPLLHMGTCCPALGCWNDGERSEWKAPGTLQSEL